MKKYYLLIIVLFLLFNLTIEASEDKYFIMTSTAYSNHPKCIAKKWRDGKTAMNTPIHEGIVAINVDKVNGKWQVKSPLRLGQRIYIEGMGHYDVEDTGSFTERDYHFDFWNIDVFFEDYEEAVRWGVKKIKVFVIK